MLIAFTLLIVWAIAELFVAIKIAETIGVPLTILALIASWPIGTWALRSQGRAAWRRLTDAIATGRQPAREVLDGGLVLAGGVLLIVPGFISDLLGAWLLAPPSRAVVRRLLVRNFQTRVVSQMARFTRRPPQAYDVDATASDVEEPRLGQ
jgi:UPF0716 protein FxsA